MYLNPKTALKIAGLSTAVALAAGTAARLVSNNKPVYQGCTLTFTNPDIQKTYEAGQQTLRDIVQDKKTYYVTAEDFIKANKGIEHKLPVEHIKEAYESGSKIVQDSLKSAPNAVKNLEKVAKALSKVR